MSAGLARALGDSKLDGKRQQLLVLDFLRILTSHVHSPSQTRFSAVMQVGRGYIFRRSQSQEQKGWQFIRNEEVSETFSKVKVEKWRAERESWEFMLIYITSTPYKCRGGGKSPRNTGIKAVKSSSSYY